MNSDPIRQTIRKAIDLGRAQMLDTFCSAMGRGMVERLLPTFQAVPDGYQLKAHDREHGPSGDPDLDGDPHDSLLLAQIDHLINCHQTGEDHAPGHGRLHALWDDPESLSHVLAPHSVDDGPLYTKAAERSPKGGISLSNKEGKSTWYPGGQWIPAKVVADASPEEKNELAERKAGVRPNPLSDREKKSAAAAERRGTREQVRKKVAELASDIMLHPGTRTPDKYRDLAELLSQAVADNHLTVNDLRTLRLKLSASFGGGRRKEQMVSALLSHAQNAAQDFESPNAAPVPSSQDGTESFGPRTANKDNTPFAQWLRLANTSLDGHYSYEGNELSVSVAKKLYGQGLSPENAAAAAMLYRGGASQGMIRAHGQMLNAPGDESEPVDPPAAPPGPVGRTKSKKIPDVKTETATLADGQTVSFVPHPVAKHGRRTTVMVDPAKLDAAWAADDPDKYIPPGGGGAEIGGRRAGFNDFMAKGVPIEQPNVTVNDGKLSFNDGRHRFSVLRDAGIDQIPVTVYSGREAKELEKRLGAGVAESSSPNVPAAAAEEAKPVREKESEAATAKQPWEMTASELESYKEQNPAFAEKYDRKYGGNFVLAHMQYIEDAMKAGKTVPLKVRKEASAKVEPWEMTKEERVRQAGQIRGGGGIKMFGGERGSVSTRLGSADQSEVENSHRETIKNAISQGKPVPDEVLADYPDLKRPISGAQDAAPTEDEFAAASKPFVPSAPTPASPSEINPSHVDAYKQAVRRTKEPGRVLGGVRMKQDVVEAVAKQLGVGVDEAEDRLDAAVAGKPESVSPNVTSAPASGEAKPLRTADTALEESRLNGNSDPVSREDFISREISHLKREFPGNEDSAYQDLATERLEDAIKSKKWQPAGEPSKIGVGDTVRAGSVVGNFRGIHEDASGNRRAVIAHDGGQISVPIEQVKSDSAAPAPSDTALSHVALSRTIGDRLKEGALGKNELWQHADKHFGGTRAEGKYGPSDAYDAMESGFNRSIEGHTNPTTDLSDAQRQARELKTLVDQLPTQTNRSGNKEAFQQFSTPPHYAFAANWLANMKPGEEVLEPSAGTGDLAVHAKNAGANVHVNELDPRRADFLRDQFGGDRTHVENAEQIAGILPKRGVKPTTVVMNPPFSQTAGRLGDKKELLTGARHIAEAGRMLSPNGRLVAIVGRGMTPDSPTYRDWFRQMERDGMTLRANMGVGGDEYKKYGTHFGTRVLMFDKRPRRDGDAPVTGDATDIPDLMAKLEGVRNDRPDVAVEPAAQPASSQMAGATEGVSGPAVGAAPATGAGVAEAGAEGGAPVAGVPDGTQGAGAGAGGGRPAVGDVPAADDVRAVRAGSEQPAGGQAAGAPAGAALGGAGAGTPVAADRPKRGKGAGGKPVQQPAPSVSGLRPPERVPVESVATHSEGGENFHQSGGEDSQYASYVPARLRIPGSKPHATNLVESSAMAAVAPPVPTYQPTLSPDVVAHEERVVKNPDGTYSKKQIGLSQAALESVVYAGQAHQQFLPGAEGDKPASYASYIDKAGNEWQAANVAGGDHALRNRTTGEVKNFGSADEMAQHLSSNGFRKSDGSAFSGPGNEVRRGYFIGDGTGAGKGRQIAGVILDNKNQGAKKHVWISEKDKLFNDAKRDWADLGEDPNHIIHWDQLSKGDFKQPEGVAFTTYSTLRSGPKDQNAPRNVDKLIDWLGKDFDGVIAFDEAHNMGNADDTPGSRGTVKASQQALAAMKLQRALPKAKVVYVSATGATKPENLAYGDRLGLWGRGTAFENKADFLNEMDKGGTSAMESVAQSMKARGLYGARSLSYDGVQTDRLQHPLTDEQKYIYDNLAEAWQNVHQNIDKAIESIVGDKKDVKHAGQAVASAKAQFQSAQQRFFNQVITSMMVPTVIKNMEKDLKEGRSPVVQLVNTMESATKRALSSKEDDQDYEELDLSPKRMLIDFLDHSFPIHRQQKVEDENGNVRMETVKDSNGAPVVDPAALAMRDELKSRAEDLRIPESPLDQIINHFGHENVSEATGRTVRLVKKLDENGTLRLQPEKRSPKLANESEARAFQDGKKKVLVFSEAGGTGASYHAEKTAGNQGQRSHYLLQPGWRADKAVQGLGRTHRTNQSSAPIFHLMETPEIPGQKRFVSTIARRLSQLGALTRGQADTGSGVELFNAADNLESKESQEGLESFINELKRGTAVNGMGYQDLMGKLGFKVDADAGGWRTKGQSEVPEMRQFLNRVLALKLDDQKAVFDALDHHMQSRIEQARANGTLDSGVERFPADKAVRQGGDRTIYRDPDSGAEAKLVKAKVTSKNNRRDWSENTKGTLPVKFVRNSRSGQVWAVYKAAPKTTEKGDVVPMYTLRGPGSQLHMPQNQVDGQSYYKSGYDELDHPTAQNLWNEQHSKLPESTERDEHFVTGDLLSVWDKLPRDKPKIYRVNLDDGSTLVGRHVPESQVKDTFSKLGIKEDGAEADQKSPEYVHNRVLNHGDTAHLSNGWKLKKARVGNEDRLELEGPIGLHKKQLEEDGVKSERIGYKDRFFVPTGPDGANVFGKVLRARNAITAEMRAYQRANERDITNPQT
jgi:predicted RNA methylase